MRLGRSGIRVGFRWDRVGSGGMGWGGMGGHCRGTGSKIKDQRHKEVGTNVKEWSGVDVLGWDERGWVGEA